jgi:hypothetical protein
MKIAESGHLESGPYRNQAGAVLHVTGPWRGQRVKTLGRIYEAEARDALFGDTPYLVTAESLSEAGYEPIPTDGSK